MNALRATIAALLAACALPALAQTFVATVPGAAGTAIAINPFTHRAYLADKAGNRVVVLDGTRGTSVEASIPVGRAPRWIAINSPFNLVYASNDGDGTLSISDLVRVADSLRPV